SAGRAESRTCSARDPGPRPALHENDVAASTAMNQDERRSATAARIASGHLPIPRWLSVHPGARLAMRCDGCGDEIERPDYAFTVVLEESVTFHFHNECFDVYNRTKYPTKYP